jgi:ring-1,2-phenylacetyl-CoA epoxidase subunit PaaD
MELAIDAHIRPILAQVSDPEIPVLSIMEMGVVRAAKLLNGVVEVTITPTYSGCPAMDVIGDDIKKILKEHGYEATIKLVLAPAWTTDWITKKGRKALKEYGIAPPLEASADAAVLLGGQKKVCCPQCNSTNTRMISQFGSTACKALFQCEDCLEPFDYFKCLK